MGRGWMGREVTGVDGYGGDGSGWVWRGREWMGMEGTGVGGYVGDWSGWVCR